MVQVISYDVENWNIDDKDYIVRELNNPRSFDEFDINVVDLRDDRIWICEEYNVTDAINIYSDLENIETIIKNSQKSNVVVILPQDITFKYSWDGECYGNSIQFRSNLQLVNSSVLNISFIPLDLLIYENTTTKIKDNLYEAAFYFNCPWANILTKSSKSEKPTTVRLDDIIITTLDIDGKEKLKEFFYKVGLLEDKEVLPQWLQSFKFFDDSEQEKVISVSKVLIEEQMRKINKAEEILKKNNEYKSILYTNGDNLVGVVFKILQQILNYDLSKFIDEKKEDFLIKKENITFIGEIKGVTSNVKSANISQVEVHLQEYLDKVEDNENVKAILIINHQRNIDLKNRQPVHEKQIELAKRYESLIVETTTLIKIFEKYLRQELNSEDIEKMLIDNTGLLILD